MIIAEYASALAAMMSATQQGEIMLTELAAFRLIVFNPILGFQAIPENVPLFLFSLALNLV